MTIIIVTIIDCYSFCYFFFITVTGIKGRCIRSLRLLSNNCPIWKNSFPGKLKGAWGRVPRKRWTDEVPFDDTGISVALVDGRQVLLIVPLAYVPVYVQIHSSHIQLFVIP